MKAREELDRAIIKSATQKDETAFLLKAVDAVVAEEIEASDKLLIAEINELEAQIQELKAQLDDLRAAFDRKS